LACRRFTRFELSNVEPGRNQRDRAQLANSFQLL
jgi:hypothetical protein